MEIKRTARQPSARVRRIGSPARCASILFQCAGSGARPRRQRHLRTRRTHGMAHASARPDADRHRRLRPGAALGRTHRRNPARRRHLVLAGREALAWRSADHGDDSHRHSGALNGKVVDWMERSATSNTGLASKGHGMSNNIEGKVVVITGASSGLGEATARLLSAQGRASCWGHGASTASSRWRTSYRPRRQGARRDDGRHPTATR